MDKESYKRRKQMLYPRDNLNAVDKDELAGKQGFTIEELDNLMTRIIFEARDEKIK